MRQEALEIQGMPEMETVIPQKLGYDMQTVENCWDTLKNLSSPICPWRFPEVQQNGHIDLEYDEAEKSEK